MVIYRSGSRSCRAIYLLETGVQANREVEVVNYFLITTTIVPLTMLEFEYFRIVNAWSDTLIVESEWYK